MRLVLVQMILASPVFLYNIVLGEEATTLDAFAKTDSHQHRQEVSPWALPQWRWLSSVFSLPQGQLDHESKLQQDDTQSPKDVTTLSLVWPLEEGAESGKENNQEPQEFRAGDESSGRVMKRSRICNAPGARCRRGEVSMIPPHKVRESWQSDYVSVPEAMIQFSQKQADEMACKDLSVQLFEVDLSEHYLEPVWVRETVHLGMCPSKLQTRYLGEQMWPTSVVETKCLCQHQSCSNLGGDFRCQPVRRPIRTWIQRNKNFLPSQEMVTVGCICVQRASPEGKYASPQISR